MGGPPGMAGFGMLISVCSAVSVPVVLRFRVDGAFVKLGAPGAGRLG